MARFIPGYCPEMARSATYGIDAPGALFGISIGGLSLLTVAIVNAALGVNRWGVLGPLLGSVVMLASAGLFAHTTLRGKFRVWADLLDDLNLRGDERVLDLGCGRGAVLIAVAKRLPQGRASGVDLWRSVDQSGNDEAATRANAEAEGVADRVELHTADLTELPFPNDAFDIVVASLAIHNIKSAEGRRRAVAEAVRVLRPGGRLVIADILHARDYARQLSGQGPVLNPESSRSPVAGTESGAEMESVEQRDLGWRYWYGLWLATRLVTARKPHSDNPASSSAF